MFSFSFASKMLNTIMGTEEQQQQQQQQGGGPPAQPGMRPTGPGFPPMRPQGLGGPSRPPTFSGPRPSLGARAGPLGGPARPTMGGVGQPHRFNGPQPPPQHQPMPGPPQGQIGMARGMSQSPLPPGSRAPSPGPKSRGPGPSMGGPQGPMTMSAPVQSFPSGQSFPPRPTGVTVPSSAGAPVPEVDLSNLSAEERSIIETVMAKAQQLEHGPPAPASGLSISQQGPQHQHQQQQHQQHQQQRMMRPEAQHPGMEHGVKMCPLCRQRDVSGKMDGMPGQECADCRLIVCNRCGGMSPHPETKRPEWTCGNCINNRRQRMSQLPPHGTPPSHHMAQGPPGQRAFGQQPPQGIQMDSAAGRRGSGGGMQQQSEREFDKIESKEKIGSWGTDTKHRRRPSFEEIFSPEKSEHSEEALHESPVDVDISFPSNPSFPDHSQCMSTHHTASASQAKPSFVINNNKLHSRSVSIDMAEKQDNRRMVLSPPQNGYDYFTMQHLRETPIEHDEPCTSSNVPPPPPPPPVDEKASALMEELSRLQSAVDSTLKRRQRQKQETDEDQFQPIRSPSPSPSPSSRGSPNMESPSPRRMKSPEKDSPQSPEGPRKAIVLKEHDLDDYKSSSEEESAESDDSDDGRKGGVSTGDVYYDHSPGEVYTIPEEEDEGGSPTGSDLVTSLKHQGFQPTVPGSDLGTPRRRGVGGQDMLHMSGADPRQPPRPQLRPQRSLDNRLPSIQPHPDMSAHQSMDQQGNLYATNNNLNTQSVAHPGLGPLDNQGVNQDIMISAMNQPTSSQQSAMSSATATSAIHGQHSSSDHYHQQQQSELQQLQQVLHQQQALQHPQQPMFGSTMSAPESQLSHDSSQRSIQQPQQLGQMMPDSQAGTGIGGANEWNNVSSQSSMMGPTASMGGVSTDQSVSSLMQSYQQQLPSSSFASHSTTSPIPLQTSSASQQFPLITQGFPHQTASYQSEVHGAQQNNPHQTLPLATHQAQQQQQFQTQVANTQPILSQHPQSHSQSKGYQDQLASMQNLPMSSQPVTTQQPQISGGALQGSQLQQLQAQQAQAQQLAQQQSWLQQSDQHQQQQNLYDQQTGRLTTSSQGYPQSQSPSPQQPGLTHSDIQYHQSMQLMQQQQNAQGLQQLGTSTVSGHGTVATSQAGPGAKSISGLLADFSRALGLGSTSPRPSPSEDKSLAFPIPSNLNSMSNQVQPLSPYDLYQSQSGVPQSISHQHSAFAPIHDSFQRQTQQSYLSQSPQSSSHLATQFGTGTQAQQSQQYGTSVITSPQPYQIVSHGSLQQQGAIGVGVIGALSPAQAHMYQQQMAMQHQQQHLKKRSRGGQLSTSGDTRKEQSTVLIGSQGLTSSGMTIGTLPAVVTSMGTFIGGGPTILGTQLIQQSMAVTPLGTPIGTPVGTPRSGPPGAGDSSDTMSETDSQKSLRMRRKLPCLPPDQEAAPLPSTKKRDRHRSQEHLRSVSPLRMSAADGLLSGRQYPFSSLSLSRPSASESNLRKISMSASDPVPRPGSALGLLQASSVVSSMGYKPDVAYPMNMSNTLFSTSTTFPGMRTAICYPSDLTTQTTSVLAGLYPSHKTTQESWNANLAELAACLPPDLRHLLNKGSGSIEHELSSLSGISGLGESSLNSGSHLPSYIRSLREQLQEERRQLLSEEQRRLEQLRERDRELGARLDAVTSRAGSEGIRSRTDLGISRSAGASPLLSRKLSHRRQLSDPKLSLPFSPIQEDGDSELQDFDRISASLLRPPYKSYEYESLEDSALLHQRSKPHFDWDHSQSYLASSWVSAGGVLRETAINSMGLVAEHDARVPSRYLSRRNSDGESSSLSTSRMSSTSRDRRHHMRKHRKSRSWHPSPYVSEEDEEEDEDMLSREEKKARIKAEIARRRQQMQERSGIHSEYSHLRDPTGHEKHSVLKSVDQLIRDQYGPGHHYESPSSYGRFLMYSSGGGPSYGIGRIHHGPHGTAIVSPSASEEDRSIERIASTFRSDELYYERLGEMSPMATDSESMGSELGAPAAMPILPDMPTRSRRLLEDLGSAPIGHDGSRGGSGSGQMMKGRRQSVQTEFLPRKFPPPSRLPPTPFSHGQGQHRDLKTQVALKPEISLPPRRGRRSVKGKRDPKHVTAGNLLPQPGGRIRKPQNEMKSSGERRKVTKHQFPVKRYLLTRDPKDESMESNGIGMKIVGGREMPDSNGRLVAYVAKLFREKQGDPDIHEGDVVLEWNGILLDDKTFEEVSAIIQFKNSSADDVELLIRSDYNILTGNPRTAEEKLKLPQDFRQQQDDDGHDTRRYKRYRNLPFLEESSQNLSQDFSNYSCGVPSGHEINSIGPSHEESRLVRSPSQSSTEATNTSASTPICGPLVDESNRIPQHVVIPSDTDHRKRSTTSLPPH